MATYIGLNPSYKLRQDGNRVILYGDDDRKAHTEDWFSFIHPYHAMMFSLLKGEQHCGVEIKNIAKYFNLAEESVEKLVRSYVSSERITIRSGDLYYFFPKNLLIESSEPIRRSKHNSYEPTDFEMLGEPDLYSLRTHKPVSIILELTMRCYVDCIYCYADRDIQRNGQMTTQQVISLIRQAREIGVMNVDINGGDVMLIPDIYEIVKTLHECGYKPLISTKIPLSEEQLLKLRSVGVEKFQISLDAADESLLRKLIKAPKGYLEAIANTLKTADRLGLKVDINSVLTKDNCEVSVIEELVRFLDRYECIGTVRLNVCGYSLYKDNYNEIKPTQAKVSEVEEFVDSEWCSSLKFRVAMAGYEKECNFFQSEREKLFNDRAICTGNLRNIIVLPNGDVTICEELYDHPQFLIGNVLQSSILDIWNGKKAKDLFYSPIKPDSKSDCVHCKNLNECRPKVGVCWKTVLMAYGKDNWDFPDPRCPKGPLPYNEIYIK